MKIKKILHVVFNKFVPESKKENLLEKWNRSTVRRYRNKYIAKKLKIKKNNLIKKYGKFSTNELLNFLEEIGIKKGDILFIQTSFNDLYTLDASPLELLSILRRLVGESGTILMPAYTIPKNHTDWVFDIKREPTYTGIINEIFRRSEGVIRSLHPRHSICGIGLEAQKILANHEKCLYADGIDSPFDKMRKYSNAKILTLGLPAGYISFLHWIDDIEPEKLPFPVHEKKPVSIKVKKSDGNFLTIDDYPIKREVAARLHIARIAKNLTHEAYKYYNYKSIETGIYHVQSLSIELLTLRDKGIIQYY